MTDSVFAVVEPLIRRGLFASPEQAVVEMTRDYIMRQTERYRTTIEAMQTKYGMTYEQFEAYLKSRCEVLAANPNPTLGAAVMTEEEDALEWKVAREMLASWLGLREETDV
jgi:hypothetical protein